jgi:hypothetical protein
LTGARVNAIELVAAHLANPASGWSIGASGVLAEFMRDPGEPCERDGFQLVTARGAIRVAPSEDLHVLAYEVLSAQPGLWHHGVLLSLPAAAAALPMRTVVTELGPDRDAIRAADGAAVLFDLGLGSSAFAFCVTSDAVLARTLRRAAGADSSRRDGISRPRWSRRVRTGWRSRAWRASRSISRSRRRAARRRAGRTRT